MKEILTLLFALSISTGSVFAWGWSGDGDCPNSKDKLNQDKTEQVEESDP